MTKTFTPAQQARYDELTAILEAARKVRDLPTARDAWNAREELVIGVQGPPRTRGYGSRAGRRQAAARDEERREAARRAADRRWK